MTWQWIFLVAFSLTVLPLGLALVTDKVPERLRSRLAPVRPRGWAFLALYAGVLINSVPRLAGAPSSVLMAATVAGGLATLSGLALIAVAGRRTRGAGA
ncbi:hypothetical protein [Streptomyces sp. NPDC005435]|uniref:hypothetical protein n=1 Tax=Streptomyces sp. NPDC005435 TaxID=3154464 RepID=UPI0034568C0C